MFFYTPCIRKRQPFLIYILLAYCNNWDEFITYTLGLAKANE